MPKGSNDTKKTAAKKPTATKGGSKQTAKKPADKAVIKQQNQADEREFSLAGEIFRQIIPYLLICLAVFITVCFIFTEYTGIVGGGIRRLCYGLFSSASVTIPVFIAIIACFWKRDSEAGLCGWKVFFSVVCLLFVAVTVHAFTAPGESLEVKQLWADGLEWIGGGAAGGLIGGLLLRGIGKAGTAIVSFTVLLVFGLFLVGFTPKSATVWIAYQIHEFRERSRIRRELNHAMPTVKPARASTRQAQQVQQPMPQPMPQPAEQGSPAPTKGLRGRRTLEADGENTADTVSSDTASVRVKTAKNGKPIETTFDAGQVVGDIVDHEGLKVNTATGEVIDEPAEAEKPSEESDTAIDEAVFDEVMRRTESGVYLNETESALEEAVEFDSVNGKNAEPESEQPDEKDAEDETLAPVAKLDNSADADIPRREDGSIALEELFDSDKITSDEKPDITRDFAAEVEDAINYREEKPDEDDDDAETLNVQRVQIGDVPTAKVQQKKPPKPQKPYELPPLTLLKIEPAPDNSDVRDELQTTAKKLVDTLTSFKVRTRIINISRGPTITRYELAPEEGVRVRSIANLVDDIALNLATTGVRIEAPIPGKSAVGIEVPNKVVATVHLRELLSHDKFKNAKSDITVGLGMDVAGDPVFCDIAKMPHLLIAGTTGSGKSVCINSMIISLLYRASPDDVKLILVDPKKVELNVYNGLPHLLVPVVSDPKKAAGALHWAVTEMERRYELIETAGVRNLEGYNEFIKDAPADENGDKPEPLSRIIIVIDELADLMMTAPDDIEESICRIAQKARAAGMHLIIGTQRPSVDVITGLIKANVPSRIAFTVSNQMDSRIIIDVGGAEKLIGRGDMLYSPIGATKPVRVQGTFVSDDEVASVCDFIKRQDYVAVYDDAVMNSIEEAAALCGAGNKKTAKLSGAAAADAGEGEDGEDSMLKPAIELAVESGKISTSLIQRRLSLGYGRAAKLIDRMQEMGIVSAPEGQKPRSVLITKQQYMEMVLNRDIE